MSRTSRGPSGSDLRLGAALRFARTAAGKAIQRGREITATAMRFELIMCASLAAQTLSDGGSEVRVREVLPGLRANRNLDRQTFTGAAKFLFADNPLRGTTSAATRFRRGFVCLGLRLRLICF
jgi:hypothetical protein